MFLDLWLDILSVLNISLNFFSDRHPCHSNERQRESLLIQHGDSGPFDRICETSCFRGIADEDVG